MESDFLDTATGGYFLAPATGHGLPLRQKELLDGAMPSASSMAMLALARLARLTGRPAWEDRAHALAACAAAAAPGRPGAACAALCALDLLDSPANDRHANLDVVIVGRRGDKSTEALLHTYHAACLPDSTLVFKDISDDAAVREIEEAYAGDIVAVVGLKAVVTGETLCDPQKPIILESLQFPAPVISIAIEPKTQRNNFV